MGDNGLTGNELWQAQGNTPWANLYGELSGNNTSSTPPQFPSPNMPSIPSPNSGPSGGQNSGSHDGNKAKILGDCFWNSFLNYYGLDAAAGVSGTLAVPIPKTWLPPYRSIGESTTNLLSWIGHYVDITIPRVTVGGRVTNNLFRLFGRVNPYLAGALFGIDVAFIANRTYNCYIQNTPH